MLLQKWLISPYNALENSLEKNNDVVMYHNFLGSVTIQQIKFSLSLNGYPPFHL